MSPASVRLPGVLGSLWAVYRKELRVLFLSPLAWVFLAAFLFLGGAFFTAGLVHDGEASLRTLMANLSITLLFAMPLVTMRQLAEEGRHGTLELLLTAPIPLGSLVVAKWLATVTLSAVLLVLTTPFAVVLFLYGAPDPGVLATSYLGLLLLCGAFGAAGLFASSLTWDSMVAGVVGVLLLLPFWLAQEALSVVPESLTDLVGSLSFLEHLRSFARGVLDTGDVAWFAGFILVFLFLAWRSVESRRWG